MNINDVYLWLKSIEGVTNNNINPIAKNILPKSLL